MPTFPVTIQSRNESLIGEINTHTAIHMYIQSRNKYKNNLHSNSIIPYVYIDIVVHILNVCNCSEERLTFGTENYGINFLMRDFELSSQKQKEKKVHH